MTNSNAEGGNLTAPILEITSTFPRWINDSEPDFIYQLCQRLKSKFNLFILAPHCKSAKKREIMEGVNVFRFQYFFKNLQQLAYEGGIVNKLKTKKWTAILIPFFMLFCLLKIIKLIRKEKINVVHAHWIIPMGFLAVIAKYLFLGKLKVLCTSHGSDMYCFNGFILKKIKVFFFNRCDHITVVSSPMKKDLINWGVNEKKISVISMGVDLTSVFTPNKEICRKPFSALFVGRLIEGKGVDVLIKAIAYLKTKGKNFCLSIIGDGPYRKELEVIVTNADIKNLVKFYGSINHTDLPDFFSRHEIFINPSTLSEGLGLVTIEAMGCVCPVVVSDFEAIHDVVEHGKTGVIVPQNDHIALADAIANLNKNSKEQKILAKNGRNFVLNKFDWGSIGNRYSSLIDELNCKYTKDKLWHSQE